MASYVVDTSVMIQYFITQIHAPVARVLVSQINQGDLLYVPEFCLLECVNVMWKQVRFRGLPQTDAEQFIVDLLDLPLQVVRVNTLLPRALLQIGLTHQLAVYDSLYIALSLNLNCPLITVDDRQLNAASDAGVVIKPITDFMPAS
ncbi:type II toxin-antitoxin system VapC family toxin [Microcoleus sp. FACHB-672]|uniref:type II toxin-antitoxin system VapC family toxin n=1 Tax=Microcoleus sp. FACHB-672 TaxID=2692825 RepID=UPI0016877E5C|nr:type II toxin-antitoxin system VapC family toxin [Microcoleus sp. FACHB-672]MBD2041116.1 type II toxin-antitoxin system VapC family toxin [Microcoleus sp. FACHB-672]